MDFNRSTKQSEQKTKYVIETFMTSILCNDSREVFCSASQSLQLPQEGLPTGFHRTSTVTGTAQYQDSQDSDEGDGEPRSLTSITNAVLHSGKVSIFHCYYCFTHRFCNNPTLLHMPTQHAGDPGLLQKCKRSGEARHSTSWPAPAREELLTVPLQFKQF